MAAIISIVYKEVINAITTTPDHKSSVLVRRGSLLMQFLDISVLYVPREVMVYVAQKLYCYV